MPKISGRTKIDIEKCKGCELCIVACPQSSIELSKDINAQGHHYAVQIRDNCTGCISCALVCPDAVITVYRTNPKGKKEPVAVVHSVTRDISINIP
jgi:2-oxoglutarate ferredoxin oxidoreductase subunit delta